MKKNCIESWLLSPKVFDFRYFILCAVAPVALLAPESFLLKFVLVIAGSALGILACRLNLRGYPGCDKVPGK